MQDIRSLEGVGGGRLFVGGGGDRRLRPNHQQHNQQALKCPRCDSLNTKFCYYNNYNLSQPRHFCKNCRRYWTKGGVLRNVPVGGGCRKSKRSKPKSSSENPKGRKSSSNSSSESSSLTANTSTAATTTTCTTAATTTAATEVVSASSSNSAPTLRNFQDSRFFLPSTSNPNFEHQLIDQPTDGGIFSDIGGISNLITSSGEPSLLAFNVTDMPYRLNQDSHLPFMHSHGSTHVWQQQQKMVNSTVNDDVKLPDIGDSFLDHTAPIDLSGLPVRNSNDGLPTLDWHGGGDQGLFDLSGNVDQFNWSQTQWVDNDLSLNYLP